MIAKTPCVSYEELRAQFRWEVPDRFNIGVACADDQPADTVALIDLGPDGRKREYTFGRIAELSSRLANALRGLGIQDGDRVAIVLPQRAETALAHIALFKAGAVAVPMSVLFGTDAIRYRLADSEAKAVVTDAACLERVAEVADELRALVIVADPPVRRPHLDFWELVESGSPFIRPAATGPDTPALIIYTSGTTGPPKGALHGHRVLLGHQPGFCLSHDFFPQEGDRFWTPADWAWIGGLVNALLCTWLHGRPMVAAARRGPFDPEWAAALMLEQRVRNAFLPPTALKMMRNAGVRIPAGTLRTVMSGGEVLGEETLAWGREHLGVTINEIYGQTEANYVVGNSWTVWEVRAGSMGRAYPGHEVAILDTEDRLARPGEVGEIGVRVPDPVVFLGYWRQPEATRDKLTDQWLRTGDLACVDEDGYFWFEGRTDDVISSAGYRIGPEEVEHCLLRHPAVALAAVIGVPDEVRGQAVKAFIRLTDGAKPSEELKREIAGFVRERLAAYQYPREIEFVDAIPLTVTGKIKRSVLRRLEEERRSGKEAQGESSPATT